MKVYKVFFHPDALNQALAAAEYIARNSPTNARRWYSGLQKAIHSLGLMPQRCGIARESKYLTGEFRHYIYKSHRIIFRIDERAGIVKVLYVRHAAQLAIGEPADPGANG